MSDFFQPSMLNGEYINEMKNNHKLFKQKKEKRKKNNLQ